MYNRKYSPGVTAGSLYNRWHAMWGRCTNPNNQKYHRYGGRGIKVCNRWATFEHFLEDVGNPPFKGATLDRIDTNGEYSKENCRWVDQKTQQNNRNNNVTLWFAGESKTLEEWAATFGVSGRIIRQRIGRDGWSVAKALTTPQKRQLKKS